LNKVDLCIWKREVITKKLHALNRIAFTIRQIDPDLLVLVENGFNHLPITSINLSLNPSAITSQAVYDILRFEEFAIPEPLMYRAKGFVQFPGGTHLFNFVGRWDLNHLNHRQQN